MKNPYQVFHTPCAKLRKTVHVVLVHPELGANVGATARTLANMGIEGGLHIIGSPNIINDSCRNLAKNAQTQLDQASFHPNLKAFLEIRRAQTARAPLCIAATARIGSAARPHPLWVEAACQQAAQKLRSEEIGEILLIFGPEGSGLDNDQIALCDWVVTIPSVSSYRSLNLAQAVLIFCYELNRGLLQAQNTFESTRPSQRERLVSHMVQVAEDVGFILPDDPFKMRPRLTQLFSKIPRHIEGITTLHGLLDQISRSVKKKGPDIKGRFQHWVTRANP